MTLRIPKLWTLVWDKTSDMIPPVDQFADGMIFLDEDEANMAADVQTDMYGDGEIVARVVPVSVDPVSE